MDLRKHPRWLVGLVLLVCATAVVWIRAAREPPVAAVKPYAATSPTEVPAPIRAQADGQDVAERARDGAPPRASGALRGKVIDAITHQPVREFKVEFFQAQGTSWRKDTPAGRDFRAKDGRFEWRPAPAGIWMIAVSAAGYQRFEIRRVRIDPDTLTSEFVMPLRKGLVVRGRVFDQASGAPIREARIMFREVGVGEFDDNFRSRPYAITSKDGSFVVNGVPPGLIALTASANGYSARSVNVAVESTSLVEIGLATAASISGRLVAQDGVTAIAGVVGVLDLDRRYGGSSRTNELGEFNFPELRAARYRLNGRADGMTSQRDVVLVDGQHLEVTLMLAQGRTLRGVVKGLPPAELSSAEVSLERDDAPDMMLFDDARVDAQGAFELRGVRAGPATIRVRTQRRMTSKTVDVPADADVNVELSFPEGFRVTGRITRGGKPLGGVDVGVVADGWRADNDLYGIETSADGRYVIDGVPRGQYYIFAARYRSRTILVSDDTEFDIDVPTTQLVGEVFDAAGTLPIVGARVDLWSTPSSLKPARQFGQSDHFGRFSLGSLDAGSYVVTVSRAGFALYREQIEFPVQSALVIRLNTDDGVTVRARDAVSGNPLAQVVMSERLGPGADGRATGTVMRIALDEQGEGRIPSGLARNRLAFDAAGCDRITIPDWNGEPLRLVFRCAGAQGETLPD